MCPNKMYVKDCLLRIEMTSIYIHLGKLYITLSVHLQMCHSILYAAKNLPKFM